MKRVDAEILTVDDLAELFACDKETAAARLTRGDLPGVKVGRGWIIPRQALFERLNEKAREEAAARRALNGPVHRLTGQNEKAYYPTEASQNTKPTALMSSNAIQTRGRKRRVPPILPPLSEIKRTI